MKEKHDWLDKVDERMDKIILRALAEVTSKPLSFREWIARIGGYLFKGGK